MPGNTSGWALLIVAGAANAVFGLPMKFVRRWEWENTWAVWTVLALIVLPVALAFGNVPSLLDVYRVAGLGVAGVVCLLGVGWGLAQVLFGKAMEAIGIGLAFSIVLGLSAAVGSVLPMLRLRPDSFTSGAAPHVFLGLVLVALGVAACAVAGRKREAAQAGRVLTTQSFSSGLAMALCSGVLASFMNLGIAMAKPLIAQASAQGASVSGSMYAAWLPLLLGGAIPNLVYCAVLLSHKATWARYRGTAKLNFLLAALMAFLWFFSTAWYGLASQWLGDWGVILGWPVFMSVIVIVAGVVGIATGEWANCGSTPLWFQVGGMLLLVLAIVSFSFAQNSSEGSKASRAGLLTESGTSLCEVYVR